MGLKGQSADFIFVIYWTVLLCNMTFLKTYSLVHTYTIITMAECAPVFNMANSAYRTRVEKPKKYKGLWSAMNKRVYILGTTLEQLRQIKEDNNLAI